MNCIERKGIVIGEGIPKIIVPIMPSCIGDALAFARDAADAGADCVELRLDFCEEACDPDRAVALVASLSEALPETLLLVTFRSKGQGGELSLADGEYCDLLKSVIRFGGADLVDVEMGIGDELASSLCAFAHEAGVIPVVSHHDFEKTPDGASLMKLLARMERLGAGICKLAVMAHDVADALRVMQVTEARSRVSSVPLLTMAMGAHGAVTRVMGELFASSMTFCSLGRASAPGQVPIAKARQMMKDIHDVSI